MISETCECRSRSLNRFGWGSPGVAMLKLFWRVTIPMLLPLRRNRSVLAATASLVWPQSLNLSPPMSYLSPTSGPIRSLRDMLFNVEVSGYIEGSL